MAINNGIVVAPINISDVASALGEGSGNIGTLCRSHKVNLWAKNKPVDRADHLFTQLDTCQGDDGNYGINIPIITINSANLSQLIPYYSQDGNGWTAKYQKNPPYRLDDSVGYYHGAKAPVVSFSEASYEHDLELDGSTIELRILPNNDRGNAVGFADLRGVAGAKEYANLGEWYIGFFIVNSQGFVVARASRATGGDFTTIAAGGLSDVFSVSGLKFGQYTVYPFMAAETFRQVGEIDEKDMTVAPLPAVAPVTLNVVEYSLFEWSASASYDSTQVIVALEVKNPYSSLLTFRNNKITYYSAKGAAAQVIDFADLTVVPTSAPQIIGRYRFIPNTAPTSGAYIIVSLGNGRLVSSAISVPQSGGGGGLEM